MDRAFLASHRCTINVDLREPTTHNLHIASSSSFHYSILPQPSRPYSRLVLPDGSTTISALTMMALGLAEGTVRSTRLGLRQQPKREVFLPGEFFVGSLMRMGSLLRSPRQPPRGSGGELQKEEYNNEDVPQDRPAGLNGFGTSIELTLAYLTETLLIDQSQAGSIVLTGRLSVKRTCIEDVATG